MKLQFPRKWRRQTPIFLIGLILFGVGVLGFGFEAWQTKQNQLSNMLSSEVLLMSTIETDALVDIPESDLENYLPAWMGDVALKNESLKKWLGKEVALIVAGEADFVIGARYRNKSAMKDWLETSLLENETFTVTKTEKGELWSPSISSSQVFLVTKKWVFASSSLTAIQSVFAEGQTLADSNRYKEAFGDLSSKQSMRLYVNLEDYLSTLISDERFAVYGPMLSALGQTFTDLGLVAENDENQWQVNSQFVLSDEVKGKMEAAGKIKNTTVPDLAHYSPSQPLLFINGQDLNQRYLYTKMLLAELNPQFELIFDGLLRAQVTRWLGEGVDFEKDVLQAIDGPYSLTFDYNKGLNWLFVTEGQAGKDIQDLIKTAQGQFSPRVETVELPDGTTREQLVAVPGSAVEIETVTANGFTYSKTSSSGLNQGKMAFINQGQYFLLASNSDLLESALTASSSENASLATNEDFRKAVLFKLGKAESFVFLNQDKLKKALEPLIVLEEEVSAASGPSWWQEITKLPIRNLILSRRVETGKVMVKWLFFMN